MGSDRNHVAKGAVEQLYRRFKQLLGQSSADAETLVREILLHEVSLSKLRRACTAVLRYRDATPEWHDDLQQEAITIVAERFSSRRQCFVDVGIDLFGGWLWKIWFNACRDAWKRQHRSAHRFVDHPMEKVCDVSSASIRQSDLWDLALEAIDQIADQELREAMLDWAGGLSAAESARRRSVARSTMAERRRRGLQQVRLTLGMDDWPSVSP